MPPFNHLIPPLTPWRGLTLTLTLLLILGGAWWVSRPPAVPPLEETLFTTLAQKGLTPQWVGPSQVALLNAAPGQAYQLGHERDSEWLHIHRFGHPLLAQATAARLELDGLMHWVAPPHFFQCDALIVLYLGQDEQVQTILSQLCGPPFAEEVAAEEAAPTAIPPSPTPKPLAVALHSTITAYQADLTRQPLHAAERARLTSRLNEASQMATLVAAPTPSMTEVWSALEAQYATAAAYTPRPRPTMEQGIVAWGPYYEAHRPRRIRLQNIWQGIIAGDRTIVYAGQLYPDYRAQAHPPLTEHGAIYLRIERADGTLHLSLHPTAEEVGPLRIIEERQQQLKLQALGAETIPPLVFDLAVRDFIPLEASVFYEPS